MHARICSGKLEKVESLPVVLFINCDHDTHDENQGVFNALDNKKLSHKFTSLLRWCSKNSRKMLCVSVFMVSRNLASNRASYPISPYFYSPGIQLPL